MRPRRFGSVGLITKKKASGGLEDTWSFSILDGTYQLVLNTGRWMSKWSKTWRIKLKAVYWSLVIYSLFITKSNTRNFKNSYLTSNRYLTFYLELK